MYLRRSFLTWELEEEEDSVDDVGDEEEDDDDDEEEEDEEDDDDEEDEDLDVLDSSLDIFADSSPLLPSFSGLSLRSLRSFRLSFLTASLSG